MRYPIIVICTLALLAASSLLAQNTTTGQIRGAITDGSAAGVPGANILAQDLATQETNIYENGFLEDQERPIESGHQSSQWEGRLVCKQRASRTGRASNT